MYILMPVCDCVMLSGFECAVQYSLKAPSIPVPEFDSIVLIFN